MPSSGPVLFFRLGRFGKQSVPLRIRAPASGSPVQKVRAGWVGRFARFAR